MKAGWLTDPHLNFADAPTRQALWETVRSWNIDVALVTGDIGEADSVRAFLVEMADALQVPIHFVLGNHDFYGGSIRQTRTAIAELCEADDRLVWMNHAGVVSLGSNVALVGHDGWGDGRVGDVMRTLVRLNDFRMIEELTGLDLAERRDRLAELGEEAADHFRNLLPGALDAHSHVVVLTHVPPFEEAAWHEGNISDEHWSPFFVCGAVGDVLREMMAERPARRMTVLCGHTHSSGEYYALPNLHVRTGGAVYRAPAWQPPLLFPA